MKHWLRQWPQRSWNTTPAVDCDRWTQPERPDHNDVAELCLAPALLLRPRSQTGLLRMYEAIAADLNNADLPVPPGLASLVAPLDTGGLTELPPNGLFPLPANREQRRVLERLRTDNTVVV